MRADAEIEAGRRAAGARALAILATLAVLGACGGGGGQPNAPASAKAAEASADPGRGDAPPGPPKEVDCGDFTTCAIAGDGLVRCWGRDKEGELGDGAGQGDRPKRSVVPGLGKVRRIALA